MASGPHNILVGPVGEMMDVLVLALPYFILLGTVEEMMDVLVFLPGGTQGPSGQRFPILYCWVQLER